MVQNLERIAENSFIHEYAHHPYQIEHHLSQFLNSTDNEYQRTLTLDTYVNVLAPTPLRARKNSIISFLTIYCRIAIDLGLPAEKSFSVSDYFINETEKAETKEQLEIIFNDILYGYKHLINSNRITIYTLHVVKAIQYIHTNLYQPLRIKDIADQLGINERYFSTLFSKEVGMPPSKYVQKQKIKTAKSLLASQDLSITDISNLLHFSDTPHFCKVFKYLTGVSPSKFRNIHIS